jgi:superfamily I DNA/RNA helicase
MTAVHPRPPVADEHRPSPSQLRAIEAEPGPVLVLAGPGAGKTYCLIQRIRFLIEKRGVDPARICAFTFTNKAAGEIVQRLDALFGEAAGRITHSTIHAFCAELLRRHGPHVGLDPGFGIADEEYQLSVLRRLEGPRTWHRSTLNRFSAFRFRGDVIRHEDLVLLHRYEKYLTDRNIVDFDTLVMKAAALLEMERIAVEIRARWDVVLVDEFQDLNPVQYRVVRALAIQHRNVFAVGDDEQSIYSWAGADTAVFTSFMNDFALRDRVHLEENRRCPSDVFALARRLVMINTPIFADRIVPRADRPAIFPVRALSFATDDDEARWIIDDLRADRVGFGHDWGEYALLYRKHEIGDRLEAAFLNAGIPCRLPRGHALSDDAAVKYVIAAARLISRPSDEVFRQEFFHVALPGPLFDEALAKSQETRSPLHRQLNHMAAHLPRGDEGARQIRRALADWRNLEATGRQHDSLASLIQELLSRRVGPVRSTLDDRHDEISDPMSLPDVVSLSHQLRDARARGAQVHLPALGGVDIPIAAMLRAAGLRVMRSPAAPAAGRFNLPVESIRSVDLPLAVFKAVQLLEMDVIESPFTSFTAIDIETTDKSPNAQVVEIAAVRVRNGEIVESFSTLVNPGIPISAGAAAVHGITDADVAKAPPFRDIWPAVREFCGADVVVAHNGYQFDFPKLQRLAREAELEFGLCTFDTLPLARDLFPTSRKLGDLARHFAIPAGRSHRALDDARTLALMLLQLGKMKQVRARKTAMAGLLDQLGVALALIDDDRLSAEGKLLRTLTRAFALGRYSNCLESYEREQARDASIPSVDELIERLGGRALMARIRAEKTAEERYPVAMMRLRRLIAGIPDAPLMQQLPLFLERIVLSKWDGHEPEQDRVNLLTLHSTKGLEFSRVYIVGAEDAQLPGGSATKPASQQEVEEARRLLYVGMTRTVHRLVMTRVERRGDRSTDGHRFLDEMGLQPAPPP